MNKRGFRHTEFLFLAACCLLVAIGLLLAKQVLVAGALATVGLVLMAIDLVIVWQ